MSSPDADWGDWNRMAYNDWYDVDEVDNRTGWTVEWKRDPSDASNQGTTVQLRTDPDDGYYCKWSKIEQLYNDSVGEVDNDYKPYNTSGMTSSGWNVGFDSDRLVSIGISQTTSESNLDVNNQSDIDRAEDVIHEFDLGGDLKYNTVRVNASACMKNVDEMSDTEFVEINLDSKYWGNYWQSNIDNSYVYKWK